MVYPNPMQYLHCLSPELLMNYSELLAKLQQLNEEQLQEPVIVMDLFKGYGYDDVQFDSENLCFTFGED